MNSSRNDLEAGWTDEAMESVTQGLSTVLLEEWGGPRSPLALEYIKERIIPDLIRCFVLNPDLWLNPTFTEIVAWKLKSQYAYPAAVVAGLSGDLLAVVQKTGHLHLPQKRDPKEPWQRIFRLWVCDESLPGIEERTGYPLAYLDLLFIRFKKLRSFLSGLSRGLPECLENPELREFGYEQLSFLYQFQRAYASELLFKERLVLEQVLLDTGLPMAVPDLVTFLEIVHTHEGCIDEGTLVSVLGEFPSMVGRLTALHFIQKNKSGKLLLTEKSAGTIAPFLSPKVLKQLQMAQAADDGERTKQILLKLNPGVLIQVIDDIVREFSPAKAFTVLESIFKQVNRRIDLHLLSALSRYQEAFALLATCLEDHDSLIRAKACEALGRLGNKEAAFQLVQMLHDTVPDVKAQAAQALGEIGSTAGTKELLNISEDYSESSSLRAQAREALRKIEAKSLFRQRVPSGQGMLPVFKVNVQRKTQERPSPS